MELTEKQIAEISDIVFNAVLQANSERRKEITAHSCICSDLDLRAKHAADHEVINRISQFLDRVENAKWGFLLLVFSGVISALLYALWLGIKQCVKGNG